MNETLRNILDELSCLESTVETHRQIESFFADFVEDKENGCHSAVDFYIDNSTNIRLFNYKGVIISLYGCWESAIRKLAVRYAELVFLHNQTEAPEQFVVSYLDKNIDFMSKQPKDWKLNSECKDFISKLHSSIVRNEFNIEEEIFFKNYPNYRINTVRDIFSVFGINNIVQHILENDEMHSFLCEKKPDYECLSKLDLKERVAFENLNLFIFHRNIIAHGKNVDEMLNSDLIIELIEYIKEIVRALHQYLCVKVHHSLHQTYAHLEFASSMGNDTAVFNTVEKLTAESCILAKKPSGDMVFLNIIGLRDKLGTILSEAPADSDVSIRFDKKIKHDWIFRKIPFSLI